MWLNNSSRACSTMDGPAARSVFFLVVMHRPCHGGGRGGGPSRDCNLMLRNNINACTTPAQRGCRSARAPGVHYIWRRRIRGEADREREKACGWGGTARGTVRDGKG